MKKNTWLIILLIGIYACQKEKSYDYPIIYTGEATQIDTSGVTLSAKLADISSSDLIEYGFVWSSSSDPTIENAEKYIIRDKPQTGIISHRVTTTLSPNVVYYFRAFARNKGYTAYGENVSFKSLGSDGPKILDFFPKSTFLGDTVTIIGEGFSTHIENNKVFLSNYPCDLISSTQDTLKFIPFFRLRTPANIVVSVFNNPSTSANQYTPIVPEIISFSPAQASLGDTITLNLTEYNPNNTSLVAFFNNCQATVVSDDGHTVKVKVPDNLTVEESNIKITFSSKTQIVTKTTFKLILPTITNFTPLRAPTGSIISLNGSNFSTRASDNVVTIDGISASIISASKTKLEVLIPSQNTVTYSSRSVIISVRLAGQETAYSEPLIISDKWFKLDNASYGPGNMPYINHTNYQGKVYFNFNDYDSNYLSLIVYDPTMNKWGNIFISEPLSYDFMGSVAMFSQENKLYLSTGIDPQGNNNKTTLEFNLDDEFWTEKKDFGGAERNNAVAFTVNGKSFLGAGLGYERLNDFWSYNALDDSWQLITHLPSELNSLWNAFAVTIGNNVYIGLGKTFESDVSTKAIANRKIFKYDANNNTWTPIADFPGTIETKYRPVVCELNGKLLVSDLDNSLELYEYDPSTNAWNLFEYNSSLFKRSEMFTINNKLYVMTNNGDLYNQLWVYDPSL